MTSSSAPPFTLEAPGSGSAPVLRREVKFALPNADAGKLRSILDVNCRRVSYGRDTSRVCSIYFDDAALSACQEMVSAVIASDATVPMMKKAGLMGIR